MKSKRLLAVFLILLLVILSSCGKNTGDINSPSLYSAQVKDTGNKIDGRIIAATDFSEGLAFVKLEDDVNVTYCINKRGKVVFQTDVPTTELFYFSDGPSFNNGHIIINGGICDAKGEITYPEDVGVTTFSDIGFYGGYILVEKVTSDYSSTKKEFGIMNLSFKWVVEPSTDLYQIIENSQNSLQYYNYNDYLYYSNDCIFNTENNLCLDIKTGKLSQLEPGLFGDETDFWEACGSEENSCLYFVDLFDNQRLKIEDKNLNMTNAYLGFRFANNHCVIGFYNEESDISYLTLINKTGKYLFDPVEFSKRGIGKCYFDGKTILATNLYSNQNGINTCLTKMKTYDTKGKLLGEMTVDEDDCYSCSLNDGAVLTGHGVTGSKIYNYYTPDFQPLF